MSGYSPFAVAIKATYEPAAQVMVAIRNSGNTCLERSSSWIELPLPVPIGGGKLGDGLETLDHLPIPEFNPGAVTVREDQFYRMLGICSRADEGATAHDRIIAPADLEDARHLPDHVFPLVAGSETILKLRLLLPHRSTRQKKTRMFRVFRVL